MLARLLLAASMAVTVVTAAEEIPRAIQVAEAPADPAPSEWITSRSKQFRVAGGESLLRATVAWLAEETRDELLKLTGEKDEWKIPVFIRLHGATNDPMPARSVVMRQLIVEGQRELRLDVHLSHGIDHASFKRAATAALLYERALRQLPAAADRPLVVPPWLTEGLREAIAWRLNQSDRRLYEALFKRGGVYQLDDLFALGEGAYEQLDGAMRAAFRVASGALVMALLEQPQGKEGFCAFLTEVASYEGEMPGLLRKHFPGLNLSATSLAKWWALQLAAKGGTNLLTDVLTITQTEAALVETLRLHFPTAEGIVEAQDLTAWRQLAALKEPERLAVVRPAQDGLVRLSYRCFPSYRPLLSRYQTLLGELAQHPTKDAEPQLTRLAQERATLVSRAARARDYLDWFEITRARQTSGAFDDYLRLKDRLKAQPHQRQDSLSQYLDRLDKAFYRAAPRTVQAPPAAPP